MKLYLPLIFAASLGLAACGGEQAAAPVESAPAAPSVSEPMPSAVSEPLAVSETEASAAETAAAPAAGECSLTVSSNDSMQYDTQDIRIPKSCASFTITLKHTGSMPKAAMGHNLVIAAESDVNAITADGAAAGADSGFLKAGDARVIAASDMIGGGEETSVSVDVAKLAAGGSYKFFCSFPGHAGIMNGTVSLVD